MDERIIDIRQVALDMAIRNNPTSNWVDLLTTAKAFADFIEKGELPLRPIAKAA